LSKNIISTVHSLSESVKNRYRFEKYLLPYFKSLSHHENNNKYDENVKYFDTKFYQNILEIMQIVFKIPESIYTVIEIKNVNKTKHQKNILYKLRNICKEETVLFILVDSTSYFHTFCVCSQRLGIVQIDFPNDNSNISGGGFREIFDLLLSINDNNDQYDVECIQHFKYIHNLWKAKGFYTECIPSISKKNKMKKRKWRNNNVGHHWINFFVAYLYLILDICQIDHNQITNKYLQRLINVECVAWNHSLPVRVLDYLFNIISRMDKVAKIEKIKPNFYRELTAMDTK